MAHKAPAQLLASLPLSPGIATLASLPFLEDRHAPTSRPLSSLFPMVEFFFLRYSHGMVPHLRHIFIYCLSPLLECKLHEDRNFAFFFFPTILYPQCLEKNQINEMDHRYRWIPTLGRMWRSITSKFPFSSQVLWFCIIVVKSRGLLILWTGWSICFTEGLWEIVNSFIYHNS